jgi:mannosylglycerate hydrolase
MGRCASCGTPVLWLRAWGFGEPRPLELDPDPAGEVVIDPVEARHRAYQPGTDDRHRYRLHWPCPAVARDHPSAGGNGHRALHPAALEPLVPVAVVPHTHWDREWYAPFQTFRLRLVHVVDAVLDLLEHDPSFSHFVLDGQTAMVDDYLDVRPEAEARIRALAGAGRLSLGPWHTQPDEFLVSGETLVRDLQAGMARSAELGGTMAVGYLPDSFGHVAQMPQLLAAAGIAHAVVFRGVPDDIGSTAFWWEAPDGSRVRAEHLALGYTNALRLPDDPRGLVSRATDLEATLAARRVGGMLLMNGGDHEPPREWLGRVVAAANGLPGSRYRFEITGLQPFLEGQPVDGLPSWPGELRASGPSTVTMGVTSNRADVRLAAAAAERAVERRAEPLSALLLPPAEYPTRLLDLAWRRLLDNAAHDSACATSADEVVDQVLVRFAEARQLGEGLAAEAVDALARRVATAPGSLLVVNAGGHRRAGLVHVDVPGRGPLHLVGPGGETFPAQILARRQPVEMVAEVPGREAGVVLDLFGPGTFAGHRVARREGFVLEVAAPGEDVADLAEVRRELADAAAARPDDVVGVTLLQAPVREVLARTGPVDGFGWTTYRLAAGEGPPTAVAGGDGWIANEHVRVDVDPVDGTLTVTTADGLRVEGLNRYVDGGDGGDTYNWSPPAHDRPVDHPEAVWVDLLESGPVRARLVVTAVQPWPVTTEVTTIVDLVAGEGFVRVETAFVNAHRDHRLRVHFPLPAPVAGSDAECAFAVIRRGLTHAGNPIEAGLPTFPARRFVDCSDGAAGLALIHDGVGEYEVVGGGRELALTLLRTVGVLSRHDGRLRPVEAGPPVPVPHAEQLGVFRRAYAIVVHRGGWEAAGLLATADDVLLPLEHTWLPLDHTWVDASTAALPAAGTALTVEGAEVTAVLRTSGGLVVRMVRMGAEAGWVRVALDGAPAKGWTMDLTGRPRAGVEGGFELGAWSIATLHLDRSEGAWQ